MVTRWPTVTREGETGLPCHLVISQNRIEGYVQSEIRPVMSAFDPKRTFPSDALTTFNLPV